MKNKNLYKKMGTFLCFTNSLPINDSAGIFVPIQQKY
jgi:hypothetical protein